MKLIRFGAVGQEKPGLEWQGQRYDTSQWASDYDETFFAQDGIARLQANFDPAQAPQVDPDVRLGAPVHRPGKLICIGLNYRQHAQESGMAIPEEPVVFFKATSAITGPFDAIVLPKGSEKTDWEVELAIVIGKRANYVSENEAMEHVAGYLLHNDVSERAFQLERGGQWVKGKSCDTFAPLGPYLVSKENITDPHNLRLWLSVNGEMMQDGNTRDFVFNIPFLVSYLSQFMSLMPGDVISTGTPAGVGLGLKPPRYLKAGDVVELGIDGLGSAKQVVTSFRQS